MIEEPRQQDKTMIGLVVLRTSMYGRVLREASG